MKSHTKIIKGASVLLLTSGILVSCGVPKKEFENLKSKADQTSKELETTLKELSQSNEERAALTAKINALNEKASLLGSTNQILMDNMGNLASLSKKGAENLEKSLESLKEKDVRIKNLQDAVTRKDSIAFALVSSVKRSLGDINDKDITVEVEKGVVYISIADNLLFASGSYAVSGKSSSILAKVAKIVNDKSDFDFIVEGHTDNVPISNGIIKDNWDLSSLRATSIVRELQNKHKVNPSRMSASGRSEYVSAADNSTAEGRAKNRRIKVILIPKLDQFYGMIEEALK